MLCSTVCYVGIPEATVATTYGPTATTELQAFLRESDSMHAHEGGNTPERQLRALLATLNVKDSDGIPVMIPGSQIVLLTDAPTHDQERLQSVIDQAVMQKVCISFFLSGTTWEGYQRIADDTGGIVVSTIDPTSVSTFKYNYQAEQCAARYGLHYVDKRSVPSSDVILQQCKYFNTSLFTSTVIVTGQTTQDSMIVTNPNGDEVHVFSNIRGEKIFRDSVPRSGQWSVCVTTGTVTITVEKTESMSATVKYLKKLVNSTDIFLKYAPHPACKC